MYSYLSNAGSIMHGQFSIRSSSINYLRYGFYVLIGLVSGREEPVL